jgi:hypothetical protein
MEFARPITARGVPGRCGSPVAAALGCPGRVQPVVQSSLPAPGFGKARMAFALVAALVLCLSE